MSTNHIIFSAVVPVVIFPDADKNKPDIIKEIKGKSGIYRWVNKVNEKSYVGSSVNLTPRLYKYFSLAHIMVQAKHSIICKALVKHGYSNF